MRYRIIKEILIFPTQSDNVIQNTYHSKLPSSQTKCDFQLIIKYMQTNVILFCLSITGLINLLEMHEKCLKLKNVRFTDSI